MSRSSSQLTVFEVLDFRLAVALSVLLLCTFSLSSLSRLSNFCVPVFDSSSAGRGEGSTGFSFNSGNWIEICLLREIASYCEDFETSSLMEARNRWSSSIRTYLSRTAASSFWIRAVCWWMAWQRPSEAFCLAVVLSVSLPSSTLRASISISRLQISPMWTLSPSLRLPFCCLSWWSVSVSNSTWAMSCSSRQLACEPLNSP